MKFSIKAVQPLILFCTLAVFSLVGGCRAAALTLVQDGKPNAEIVISAQPERTVRVAAQQLQDSIAKISGARLPIVTQPSGNAVKLFVGHSAYTDDLKVTAGGLKAGAYRIQSGDDWIVLIGTDTNFTPIEPWAHSNGDIPRAQADWDKITGTHLSLLNAGMYRDQLDLPGSTGKPEGATTKPNEKLTIWDYDERGSFNAVCGLLRKLGVRWYMPGELGEVVPEMKTISVPKLDETVHPDFPVRRMNLRFDRVGVDTAMWVMRLGLRSPYGLGYPHGLRYMTDSDEVREAHPDWFALYGGVRNNQPGLTNNQLCLSSEGLLQAAVHYARLVFDHYDYDVISVQPPDGFLTICQCPLCKGKDTPERGSAGRMSDYVWDFVNRVAKEVRKTHPDKKISCIAYSGYALPPANIAKLEPNVLVKINGGRRPIADKPEERKNIRQRREEWLAKTSNPILIGENYPFTSRGFYLPAYQPHVLGESINATKGISMGEDIWSSFNRLFATADIGYNHFPVYFTARLYWGGKDADADAMFREYCDNFYGPAAQEMQTFFTYCEDNWREMEKDKTKADKALALFAAAKAKSGAASLYGKRIALIDDYLEKLREKSAQLGKARGPVPILRLAREAKGIVIDGKLDDDYWKTCPNTSRDSLRETTTGQAPAFGTTFKTGWNNGDLYFAIRCDERPGEKPNDMATKKDNQTMWMGDCIEIELETNTHSYYQIAVSPSGVIADLDRSGGKLVFDWDSQAEVATQIGDGYWTAEMRIPVTTDDSDPLHQVVGDKPTLSLPWFINICRQRIRENGSEYSAFSPTGGSFHMPLKFAYFYSGDSHKFEAEPNDDYLNDLRRGEYAKAAARKGMTDRQKSYAFELAADKERRSKNWEAADKIAEQIPVEAVKKTVQMQNLLAQGKAAEVVKSFGGEEISAWPFWKRSDGYFMRGQAYAATGAGQEAATDFKRALEFTSDWRMRQRINLEMGQTHELLKDDTAALAAYQAAVEGQTYINGSTENQAVQGAARMLTRQGKFDEALKELDRIDTKNEGRDWRDSTLLARAATLEAMGRKAEAEAIYKAMLADKATLPRFRKAAEEALSPKQGEK